ncbi:DUF2516 family protein [Stackebrandtia nassauensis]|uniref:DUF2516 family protein n=1 Tax=Stackebrandtia nassauensis (strain DSM 44728 / CIP 108903 / NRRL B-16338 / NBRC 102104 / LLR-40K-21) TaxID=446470 RepID=D3PY69_STANL|nr:DUF2516 family protein [Stackebrandtia nassauensis]ADD45398.1 hypothetical protein Snas_5768 [Stackebrandtia nassauensis DSM 44728]
MEINGFPAVLVIEGWTEFGISAVAALLSLAALLHCALQKPSAFPAVGPLTKGLWLGILAGCILLSMLGIGGGGVGAGLGLIGIIGLIASLVYLLDIRPAIRDLGSNPW